MSLIDKISGDIKTAMLAKDKRKLEALRAIKAAMLLVVTSQSGSEVSEEIEIQTLQRLVKQRNEAADTYAANNRPELAEEERYQASIIQDYLPEQLSENDIKQKVAEIIKKIGATGMKDMGKVMGIASKEMAGKTDNKIVSAIIKQLLAE
ncbi:MAG: GatB/YqeY domain-containing protein [Bacteroidales bacterium]|jgi:uncharacterized protein YqeY|nr:GatB/YqeY domain-containing protein [Bacteroidales bacterium]